MAIKEMRSLNFGGPDTYVPVPTDWNQTDETQPDFLKNRPFGDTKQEMVPLGDAQFTFSEEDGGYVAYWETNISLRSSDFVEVVWDNTLYSCGMTDAGGFLVFGNLSIMGLNDTGEPFTGMYQDGLMLFLDLYATEETTRNISVAKVEKRKVPVEYLPGAVTTYYGDVNGGYLYSDTALSVVVTAGEAAGTVMNGIVSIQFPGQPMRFAVLGCSYTDGYMQFECVGNRIYYTAEYVPD